jgi:hypothetical protein
MAVGLKVTAFWDVSSCSLVEVARRFRDAYCLRLIAQIKAVSTSEKSISFCDTTRRNTPEGCHLRYRLPPIHTGSCRNQKRSNPVVLDQLDNAARLGIKAYCFIDDSHHPDDGGSTHL